jgi:hypothetical protein
LVVAIALVIYLGDEKLEYSHGWRENENNDTDFETKYGGEK